MKTLVKWLVPALLLSGCVSREYVHDYVQEQLKPLNTRIGSVEGRVNRLDERASAAEIAQRSSTSGLEAVNRRLDETRLTLQRHGERLDKNEADIAQVSRAAREALERAIQAGKLAEGKMAYEVVFSEDKVKFDLGRAQLNPQAKEALAEFIARLKLKDKQVYVEVQGHTDNSGNAEHNLKVGQQRAEAVRRYLNQQGGLPLHRVSAVSYGETLPAHSNASREGRMQNRRVVLVVLY